jgi:hypothetical protein
MNCQSAALAPLGKKSLYFAVTSAMLILK